MSATRERAKLRVLVAEDDPEMRALVADTLRDEGFEVDEAEDGRRMWIRTLHPPSYDLVVSDVRLPVVDGLTVVEDLRGRDRAARIIVTTAFGDAATRTRAANVGAVFLDKPFRMGELCAAAHRLCEGAARRGTP